AIIRSDSMGGYIISDLGSGNGTFINNQKIDIGEANELKNGDLISIGSTRILFIGDDVLKPEDRPSRPIPAPATAILMNDSSMSVVMEVGEKGKMSIAESIDASVDMASAGGDESSSTTIDRLKAMIQLSNEIVKINEHEALLDKLMEKIFVIFPDAARAFILTKNPVSGEMVPAIGRSRNKKPGQPEEFAISSTIINMVIEKKQAIISNDAQNDSASAADSDASSRSMMCVPMICDGDILGIINIDTLNGDGGFDKDDLNMLAGIASQAARAISGSSAFDKVEARIDMCSQLSRYMSPDMARKIAAGSLKAELEGHKSRGTLLFSDISGFSGMADDVAPEQLISAMNRFFKITTDIIARNSGTMSRFDGDMVMAFWNVMFPDDEPESHAITTAMQMQASVWYYDLDLRSEKIPSVNLGIGIHTGEFSAGNIGGERVEYAVVGSRVMEARVIEEYSSRWQILASEQTYQPIASICSAIEMPPIPANSEHEDLIVYSIRGFAIGAGRMLLNIPVRVVDGNGNLLGEGLITGSEGLDGNSCLYFSSEAVTIAGQKITLVMDLPELGESLEVTGIIEDENKQTHYGQATFCKSILGNLEADQMTRSLFIPGTMLESGKSWDNIRKS
ncbi:MAG: GAF domain-containing protein, partial [Planctomycetes bacterium]|nr:GAF domain-containing protein [Planctomycetota bacterium]